MTIVQLQATGNLSGLRLHGAPRQAAPTQIVDLQGFQPMVMLVRTYVSFMGSACLIWHSLSQAEIDLRRR